MNKHFTPPPSMLTDAQFLRYVIAFCIMTVLWITTWCSAGCAMLGVGR